MTFELSEQEYNTIFECLLQFKASDVYLVLKKLESQRDAFESKAKQSKEKKSSKKKS